MEIIEQGGPPRDRKYGKIYQFKCSCGCRFNAQWPNDFLTYGWNPGDAYSLVGCPCCKKRHKPNLIAELRYYFNSPSITEI